MHQKRRDQDDLQNSLESAEDCCCYDDCKVRLLNFRNETHTNERELEVLYVYTETLHLNTIRGDMILIKLPHGEKDEIQNFAGTEALKNTCGF